MNERVRNILIPYDTRIIDVLKKMDDLDRKLLILEKNGKFFSLVSIGDIQRAIIKGINLSEPVHKVTRQAVRIASLKDTFENIKEQMLKYRMEFLPVVENGKIINVYFWEDLFGKEKNVEKEKIDVPVIIMAGGKGTRLRPITNIIPKPLIPLGEKTVLEVIIQIFKNYGVKDFYLTLNYKKEMIKYYLKYAKIEGISYVIEEEPLGTAGSLSLLRNVISQNCIVTNCDIIIKQDYHQLIEYHKKSGSVLTIVGVLKNERIPYGVIKKDSQGNVIKIEEKPLRSYIINSGMYVLEKKALEYIPQGMYFDMTDLINVLIEKGEKVKFFPVSEGSWLDVGDWDKYNEVMKRYEIIKRFIE
ncbi:MAG: hypothetical protein PWQ20_999 [Thermotogaceae bacterium]|nr:hypothetical protein [Thermotogaceae bacterium]